MLVKIIKKNEELIMKDTLIFGEKPYPEYIKELPDWELPDHKPKFTDQYKAEFDEWLKKFQYSIIECIKAHPKFFILKR